MALKNKIFNLQTFSFFIFLLFLFCIPITLHAQIRVAIAEFENRSGEFYLDQWQQNIPGMLQTYLSKSDKIIVLERRKLKNILEEKALALTGLSDSIATKEIGEIMGAEYLIYGTIQYIDQKYRIDANIVKVSTGQTIGEKVVSQKPEYLEKMVNLLGNNIMFQLIGKGKYKPKVKVSRTPKKYFLAGTIVLGVSTYIVGNQYKKYQREYDNNLDIDRFDEIHNNANRMKKATIMLGTLTGVALTTTLYLWIKDLRPNEIYADNKRSHLILPYLAFCKKNEVLLGVQISL